MMASLPPSLDEISPRANVEAKSPTKKAEKRGSKFYPKNLTLFIQIMSQIDQRKYQADIAKALGIPKSLVSYYVKKGIELGYIADEVRDVIRVLRLTQAGKNFLAQYLQDRNDMVALFGLRTLDSKQRC